MKLIDLLSVINENCSVYVYHDNEMITYYNGRDSIDEIYNNCSVLLVSACNGALIIDID